MTDHYKVLGIPRDASQEDVKRVFRERSKYEHPDKLSQDAPPAIRAEWDARFKSVTDAYETLYDPVRRAAYDSSTSEQVDVVDLVAYGTELLSTIASLRAPEEPPGRFASRFAFAAAQDAFRMAQTQEGRRAIQAFANRIGRRQT